MTKDDITKNLIKKQKIITIGQITEKMKCSTRTAQRKIKKWKMYTSYNCNSRYYTLPGIPAFDELGIWRHKSIFFSRHGNLTQTVVNLVTNSEKGLEHQELCKILGISASSIMSHFRNIAPLQRLKISGRVVYFSQDENKCQIQKQNMAKHQQKLQRSFLQDTDSILILVDRIKFPHSTLEQCVKRLHRKSKRITLESVKCLLEFHGILEKKTHNIA
ncbi:MAG: HTH domain-containing protein [archaeon]|nr:HTH domain-containing protein [archaeon]